ncbi:MAG: hypothetical protein ACRC4N_18105 [Gammaproteobacteria bacterium]
MLEQRQCFVFSLSLSLSLSISSSFQTVSVTQQFHWMERRDATVLPASLPDKNRK